MSQDQEEQSMSKVCRWNTCFKNCMNATGKATTPVRATCKANCKCWFLEAEDEAVLAQDAEINMDSSVCRWNNCYNSCKHNGGKGKYCKKYCNCWFLEEELGSIDEEEFKNQEISAVASSCYYYAAKCKAWGYKYVNCYSGYCSNYAIEEETSQEISTASCTYYAQRCRAYGYKYVYCSTGYCSNLAAPTEAPLELQAAPCYAYARRCKYLGYKYVYCSTGTCSNYVQEEQQEVAASSPCVAYARRCIRLGYKYVYCGSGRCSN